MVVVRNVLSFINHSVCQPPGAISSCTEENTAVSF